MVNGMDSNNSASPTSEEAAPVTTANSTPPVPVWSTSGPTTVWPLEVEGAATDVTTSTALLEVSQTPGPCDASPATTTPTSASNTVTAGEAESGIPSDISSTGSAETVTDPGLASPSATVKGSDGLSSEAMALPGVETGPDSSVQQVAAEEMVMGEEVAVPTTQDAAVDTVIQESVVETSAEPVSAQAVVPSQTTEATLTEKADWLCKH